MGRATQGVKLINLKTNDSIAAVAKVMHEEDENIDIEIDDVDTENILDKTDNIQSEDSNDK